MWRILSPGSLYLFSAYNIYLLLPELPWLLAEHHDQVADPFAGVFIFSAYNIYLVKKICLAAARATLGAAGP